MNLQRLASSLLAVSLAGLGTVRADFTADADLNGAQEVPANASAAFGSAALTYTTSGDSLAYSVSFGDLLGFASVAHIHFGDPGLTGPVILPLANPGPPSATSGTFLGTLTSADLIPSPASGILTFADAIAAIRGGHTYVDIHETAFPGGEIRGQFRVRSIPEPASLLLMGVGIAGIATYGWRSCRMAG